jgi:hypothetical protein
MFFPVDPNAIDGMWGALLESLSSANNCVVVLDGVRNYELKSQALGDEEALRLLEKFKSRDYLRIGCSRMVPVPAYFSVDLSNGSGRLMELISSSSDHERLRKDLSLVCQFSFFENKFLQKLVIPFVVVGLEDSDLRFEVNREGREITAYRI